MPPSPTFRKRSGSRDRLTSREEREVRFVIKGGLSEKFYFFYLDVKQDMIERKVMFSKDLYPKVKGRLNHQMKN